MTWNLWGRYGDLPRRREAILRTIADVGPDVCCLQEVPGDTDRNLAAELAAQLGMACVFASRSAAEDPGDGIGNAVLSRWPIGSWASVRLDGSSNRTVCHALVDAPRGPLPLFTTHLTYGLELSALRATQVRSLAHVVVERSVDCAYPPIVTGDLNAEPDSDEIRMLGGVMTAPAAPGLVLLDAWRFAANPAPGYTWSRRNPYLARTALPDCRIDYVLVGVAHDGTLRVRDARLAGDQPVEGVWASDHFAVVAELES